jgi:hypothetical protein
VEVEVARPAQPGQGTLAAAAQIAVLVGQEVPDPLGTIRMAQEEMEAAVQALLVMMDSATAEVAEVAVIRA